MLTSPPNIQQLLPLQYISPIFPSFLIEIYYKRTMHLFLLFGSAKNWLIQVSEERKGIHGKAECLILRLLVCLLYINSTIESVSG
jgi:hypothetical protein